MIKATDRPAIGDWFNVGGHPMQISKNALVLWLNGLAEFKPIPLTEEWLLRAGFEKSSGVNPNFSFGNTMLIFRTDYESDMLENYWQFKFGIASGFRAERQVRLDYVHQLQNLTQSLTGTELIFKP